MNEAHAPSWLAVFRRYLLFIAVANLVWEFAQIPLYTIWREGTAREIAFAAVHCTGGDILIALAALAAGLVLVGGDGWPSEGFWRVGALTVALGLSYTIFSEWLNIEIRGTWAYSELMPTLPLIDAGLAPFSQWIVIPFAGLWWARRPVLALGQPRQMRRS
jgi:hypothetical protein